jgi:multicomponent Na+:H+ antiporter subunit D
VSGNAWLPLAILMTSLAAAPLIFAMREESTRLRTAINLAAAGLKIALVAFMSWQVAQGETFEARFTVMTGLDLVLQADPLAVLFVALSAVLWLLTTIYAVGYLEGSAHRSRFFGFFSLCVAATVGIAMAGNLFTFLIFYEVLTLATYPLVVHRGSPEAIRAGRVYLAFTIGGGLALFIGVVWLWALAGSTDFVPRGILAGVAAEHRLELQLIFALLVVGLGVKAAIFPLHHWLPISMVAPAPVSALLHAVAVVKAGAFGIMRVVYELYGVELAADLGVTQVLAVFAAVTIIYGSLRALTQDDLKRRLAFSTVAQVSYITLGVALASPAAAIGGLAHLIHQGLMKITMFLCVGNLTEQLGVKRVSEMRGVGYRMPWTMAAFTVAALAMIGVPPLAGFLSKWYLASGALAAGEPWVLLILVASGLLNAAYFLPILHLAWFERAEGATEAGNGLHAPISWMMLAPPLVTASLIVLAGTFASAPFSPLGWTRFIVSREYS